MYVIPSIELNNDVKMPVLGLGVWKMDAPGEAYNAVLSAIECGYRMIDTAAIYKNEEEVGRAIKDSGVPRKEIFLTTKLWNDDQRDGKTIEGFEASLSRLKMDYVDLYLIHWPYPNKYAECFISLIELYKEGLVRAVGVSNFSEEILEDIKSQTDVLPAVNQIELHPLASRRQLREYCVKEGIQVQAWSPLMRGRLDYPLLIELAAKYNKTPAQIILRWHLDSGIAVIPKSSNPERIRQNADVFDFSLDIGDILKIDALNEDNHFGYTLETFDFK